MYHDDFDGAELAAAELTLREREADKWRLPSPLCARCDSMNRLVTSIRPALGRSISSATLGARPAARRAPQMALVPSRGLNDTAYQTFFKSNVRYVTFIVAGAVALEVVYGSATDMLWESMNRGVSVKAAQTIRRHVALAPHAPQLPRPDLVAAHLFAPLTHVLTRLCVLI